MTSGVKDIQLLELKDTILQLNKTISEQNNLIVNLQKMLEERNTSDAKKDQIISNLQAQLEYLKQKLFGSTSEMRKSPFPGQMNIFDYLEGDVENPAIEAFLAWADRQHPARGYGAKELAVQRHSGWG
jgi:uncharacterized coiled-coil protein SlyX